MTAMRTVCAFSTAAAVRLRWARAHNARRGRHGEHLEGGFLNVLQRCLPLRSPPPTYHYLLHLPTSTGVAPGFCWLSLEEGAWDQAWISVKSLSGTFCTYCRTARNAHTPPATSFLRCTCAASRYRAASRRAILA